MIPKMTQIDTDQVARNLKLVGVDDSVRAEVSQAEAAPSAPPVRTPLPPELQEAFDASWEQNEEIYRYLGR